MKKFIRYLYEYQNGKRVQNVGFVKVEQSDDCQVIQIYGKGFPAAGNQEMEVFAFYMMGQLPVGISMGKIKGSKPMFGYRLEFTPADVGGQEIFDKIDGMILLNDRNGFQRWYAAIWDERPVAVEKMMRREDVLRRQREEEPENEVTEEEAVSGEIIEPERDSVSEEAVTEESVTEEAVTKEAVTEEAAIEEAVTEEEIPEEEILPEEETPEETFTQEETEAQNEPQSDMMIYKITRKDIAKLPRREWRLANNNFLLHGYYNYHHLVSFEKDGSCWLGVPGIYHPKEQRAADALGFGQFMKPDEGEIDLAENEMSAEEDFGYWCRRVGNVIEK